MNFETFFRFISYTAVFCGFFSLWVSGTFGFIMSAMFISVVVAAWFLEDSGWQISESVGTILIVGSLPLMFLAWRAGLITLDGGGTAVAGVLARLILALSAIKLLQQKSSRDWVFLYLMSFFEVMLAAGLSISAVYLGSFLIYLLVMVCAIVTFEIRKTAGSVERLSFSKPNSLFRLPTSRLPITSLFLIGFIILLALPLFFALPRVGGAGFGGRSPEVSASTGFSDVVTLGGVGMIQENDAIVMRVRLEGPTNKDGLYFRGLMLDTFNNKAWSRSKTAYIDSIEAGESGFIKIDNPRSTDHQVIQTIYLEPLDTPYLFTLSRPLVIQGNIPFLYKDAYGALSSANRSERTSYKVVSDRSLPAIGRLRGDQDPYPASFRNFRQLPSSFDLRIAELAESITQGSDNRYDMAKAVESYLQNSYGYTLERKAGGREPLADFLFNVKEGHCEYFATAMAVMLRTQGVATRIVNGFHGGEFNDAAGVTIVRQRNAHAWVEVYFPGVDAWVPFDPTPAVGLPPGGTAPGFAGTLKKYVEALETFWIQYFVAFDNQEQRSLARSVRSGVGNIQGSISTYFEAVNESIRSWWSEISGKEGGDARLLAIARLLGAVGALIAVGFTLRWLFRKVVRSRFWKRFHRKMAGGKPHTIIEFYERLLSLLEQRGLVREPHQTPLEFAAGLNMPEAVLITDKYNHVRFGGRDITSQEARQIDGWLRSLAASGR